MNGKRQNNLDVSVVVTTRDRPSQLAVLLHTLYALDYPHERFDVVVIDDGSRMSLESVVRPFMGRLQIQFLRLDVSGGPGHGRNAGARLARGRWLAFTDDDCEPEVGWLSALVGALGRQPLALVGGRVNNGLEENIFSSASQLIVDIVYAYFNDNGKRATFFATNNVGLSAIQFHELGGFDESYRFASEDRDFCSRWRAAGWPMVYEPAAAIQHKHPLTLRSYCRQHFAYGQGAVHFRRRLTARGSDSGASLGMHCGLPRWLLGIWRQKPALRAAKLTLLLAVWQVANAAGFLRGLVSR